ncbi:MAG: hypothetical protein OEM77_01225 [Nitrosopumilus sp.]|nr:hypothetical protein [Nitrosopumilus sp.]MDH3737514.1 hypothetical protein [Nitrosopumilus sp.]MDH3824082.1 hypothetical protein [Nitrosopumilus sp.]MDH3834797.1 hypothetical protein [Nitrosopumilus sp.]
MVLFARNRRYYLIPVEHKKEIFGDIFDKHQNLIGRIRTNKKDMIIVTEVNGTICLRIKEYGSKRYTIEDHFGNYLGNVLVPKRRHEKLIVEDRFGKKILSTRGFVEWVFTIQNERSKKIAVGCTTNLMFSIDKRGTQHGKPSFLFSVRPHHPDSRFLLAIFIILLKKMRRTDITELYVKFGPAIPL